MTLKGVILDIDGTMVLSNDAHAQAWVEAFAAFGYDVPFERVRPLIGMGGDQVIPNSTMLNLQVRSLSMMLQLIC